MKKAFSVLKDFLIPRVGLSVLAVVLAILIVLIVLIVLVVLIALVVLAVLAVLAVLIVLVVLVILVVLVVVRIVVHNEILSFIAVSIVLTVFGQNIHEIFFGGFMCF